MKMRLFLLFALLASCLAFAGVDVSSYSVSPSTLRPGLSGSVIVSLENTGSDTVSGVRTIFTASGFTISAPDVYVGDLAASGTSTITVPLKANADLAPGSYNVVGRITWVGGAGETSPYKLFSIPVNVESASIVQAENVSISKQPLIPGDAFTLSFVLHNTGSEMRDAVISTNSTTFILTGQARVLLGDLSAAQSTPVQLPLTVSTGAGSGTQQLPLQIDFTDAFGQSKVATVTITPIFVEERSIDFFVDAGKVSGAVSPGSVVKLSVNVKNIGNDAALGTVAGMSVNSSVFTSLGPSEVFVGALGPNEDKQVEFELGINGEATAGYYPLTVTIDYRDKTGKRQAVVSKRVGVQVSSRDVVSVISSTKPEAAVAGARHTLSLRFFNVGTNELRGASASISSDSLDLIGSQQEYIGSITLDNPETVQFEVFIKNNVQPGAHEVNYTLDYVDAYNTRKQLSGVAFLQVVSPETAAAYKGNGGTNPLVLFAGLVILVVIAWFAYKRFVKKKTKQ